MEKPLQDKRDGNLQHANESREHYCAMEKRVWAKVGGEEVDALRLTGDEKRMWEKMEKAPILGKGEHGAKRCMRCAVLRCGR